MPPALYHNIYINHHHPVHLHFGDKVGVMVEIKGTDGYFQINLLEQIVKAIKIAVG